MRRAANAISPLVPALALVLALAAGASASDPPSASDAGGESAPEPESTEQTEGAGEATDSTAQQEPGAEVERWIDQLDTPEHEQRERATTALMQNEGLSEGRLMDAVRSAASPEQRHRLIRIAMHHYYRQLNPEEGTGNPGKGSLGIHTPAQSVIRPEEHPRLDHPAMMVTKIYPGFPAFVHLRPGDLIFGIEGEPFGSAFNREQFGQLVKRHDPGERVTLMVLRNGERVDVPVRLASYPRLEAVSRRLDAARGDPALYPPWLRHRQELLGSDGGPSIVQLDPPDAEDEQDSPSNDGISD